MSTSRPVCVAGIAMFAVAVLAACAVQPPTAKPPALGAAVSAEEVARWDISIPPSGAGLPAGSGTVAKGESVYAEKCQSCHGPKGAGKPADALVGGSGSLATATPVRTVGSYWPYATTLFDYTRRAMPITSPLSLTSDEVYAVTAYVLYLNGIIPADATMNAQSLPAVKMPNREGFISDWPPKR
jgi:S-disulfanyl-L-cysteine oxidoreductase SoxD